MYELSYDPLSISLVIEEDEKLAIRIDGHDWQGMKFIFPLIIRWLKPTPKDRLFNYFHAKHPLPLPFGD